MSDDRRDQLNDLMQRVNAALQAKAPAETLREAMQRLEASVEALRDQQNATLDDLKNQIEQLVHERDELRRQLKERKK